MKKLHHMDKGKMKEYRDMKHEKINKQILNK